MSIEKADPYQVKAYRRAAKTVPGLGESLELAAGLCNPMARAGVMARAFSKMPGLKL
jgi:hypothetical protein